MPARTPSYAITGVGLVCPLGADADTVFAALADGQDAFRVLDRFPPEASACRRGGQLPADMEDKLRADFPDQDLALAMICQAGREALSQGGGDGTLALVLGTNFGFMETQEWAWEERRDTGLMDAETYAPCDALLADIAGRLGADGPLVQLSMSCASGAATLRTAADILRQGRAERVLALSYDVLTEYCWCGLSNLHTITTDTVRPFDARRSGTVFSEGAAAVLLDARADSALAWLRGAATNNNAFHLTAPPREAEGSRRVMQDALDDAGLSPDDIEHVSAHATGTRGNDSTESAAIRNLFGDRDNLTIAAHKSQLGHLLGAAGLAEAIVTVMAMRQGLLPPIIHAEEPADDCAPLAYQRGLTARPCHFRTAITNAAGLGGNNAATVLSLDRGTPPHSPSADRVYLRQLAWILPAAQGQGDALLAHPEWLSVASPGTLADFNPKPFLRTTKGYLDPSAAFQLAAFSLLYGETLPSDDSGPLGLGTATRYGAQQSAFGFFRQMREKGPRLASPLIFPHGYASTAGNLSAIEFGIGGPHQVFYGNQDVRELLFFALARLSDGSAAEMAVGANEGAPAETLPDDRPLLRGALALRLAATPALGDLGAFSTAELADLPPFPPDAGAVAALGNLIIRLLTR